MAAWNYLWCFVFSLFLCAKTGMTEGRNLTMATAQTHVNGSVSTDPNGTTGPAAHNSSAIVAEPNTTTAPSLLDTSFLSPSTMRMVGGEGRTASTAPNGEGSSRGTSARGDVTSPDTPTTGPGSTASGIASSLSPSPSPTVTSHSLSSPGGSTAAAPSPPEEGSATTAHPSTTLFFSTSGITSARSAAVTAEPTTHSPATPRTAASSTPGTSPASGTTEASLPSTPGRSTETLAAEHTSTLLTRGPATGDAGTAPSSTGSPSPPTTTASTGNSATTPPGEGESPTIDQGSPTTNGPSAGTSHSLPDTSFVTPSTPNLNIPTSVNPSVTGTCSPITLSIQLENVTSTMIQFSWKPQGGTADSPYTVLLRGKSGEMEKKILNGTSTTFANLLSGHQYQISVNVSTCSKNVSTSLTVQTAAEVYSGTTRIINEEFKPEYQDKSSREFQEFETTFIAEITRHLPQEIQELKNGTKMRIVINSIENGSVIVLFDVVLDVGQNITRPEISDAFTEALNMSTEFKVDLQKTVIEARNSCQPGLNDCSQNAACTPEGATYSCQCKEGFTDNSPQVPGRVCQQNLPSQQMTTIPQETETTGVTQQTTSISPETDTTGVTGVTEQTTSISPETDITGVTGVTEQTTSISPETHITGVTEQTTSISPETDTTGVTQQTTSISPETSTTGVTQQTTSISPETSTTGVTEQTTSISPETDTTGVTQQTTSISPETSITGVTQQTTSISPETSTTGVTQQTTSISPETSTTGVTQQTTSISPETSTTGVTQQTTSISPETSTTGVTEQTTSISPETHITGVTEQTTSISPETSTTGVTQQTTSTSPETSTTGVTQQTPSTCPETNTTGFTGSTSNSTFTTTFPSPPCMPVSIEIQNVTGEEIKLSWTGGSTGSFYSISLIDGRQEINKTTTKETKAVFEHLLPAHVYTISVGVSSCTENKTSVTVRTDPISCFNRIEFCLPANTGCSDLKGIVCSDNKAFACRVSLKSQVFNNTLYNTDSEEYKAMAESIKRDVVSEMRLKLKNERFDIIVLGFRSGSVTADFISLLPKEEPIDVDVLQTHLSQVLKDKFGDKTELDVYTLSVQSPADNIYPWKVAVIVLGVLLGVAVVLILLAIIFYICTRKSVHHQIPELLTTSFEEVESSF